MLTRSQQAYKGLKDLILSLEIPPGVPVSEKELSHLLGTSRTPVREALQRLAREGLVQLVPGRGAFVADIALPDVIELFQMREALEPYAARLATRHAPRNRDGIHDFIARLDGAVAIVEGEEPTAYYRLTAELDAFIVDLAANRRLKGALHEVWTQFGRVRRISVTSITRLLASIKEHQDILHAIDEGDEDASAEVASRHVRRSREHFMSAYSSVQTRDSIEFPKSAGRDARLP